MNHSSSSDVNTESYTYKKQRLSENLQQTDDSKCHDHNSKSDGFSFFKTNRKHRNKNSILSHKVKNSVRSNKYLDNSFPCFPSYTSNNTPMYGEVHPSLTESKILDTEPEIGRVSLNSNLNDSCQRSGTTLYEDINLVSLNQENSKEKFSLQVGTTCSSNSFFKLAHYTPKGNNDSSSSLTDMTMATPAVSYKLNATADQISSCMCNELSSSRETKKNKQDKVSCSHLANADVEKIKALNIHMADNSFKLQSEELREEIKFNTPMEIDQVPAWFYASNRVRQARENTCCALQCKLDNSNISNKHNNRNSHTTISEDIGDITSGNEAIHKLLNKSMKNICKNAEDREYYSDRTESSKAKEKVALKTERCTKATKFLINHRETELLSKKKRNRIDDAAIIQVLNSKNFLGQRDQPCDNTNNNINATSDIISNHTHMNTDEEGDNTTMSFHHPTAEGRNKDQYDSNISDHTYNVREIYHRSAASNKSPKIMTGDTDDNKDDNCDGNNNNDQVDEAEEPLIIQIDQNQISATKREILSSHFTAVKNLELDENKQQNSNKKRKPESDNFDDQTATAEINETFKKIKVSERSKRISKLRNIRSWKHFKSAETVSSYVADSSVLDKLDTDVEMTNVECSGSRENDQTTNVDKAGTTVNTENEMMEICDEPEAKGSYSEFPFITETPDDSMNGVSDLDAQLEIQTDTGAETRGDMETEFPISKTDETMDEAAGIRTATSENAEEIGRLRPRKFRSFLLMKERRTRAFLKQRSRILGRWFVQNFTHPYPSKTQKDQLAKDSNMSRNQVSEWFGNMRRRIREASRGQHLTWEERVKRYNDLISGKSEPLPILPGDLINSEDSPVSQEWDPKEGEPETVQNIRLSPKFKRTLLQRYMNGYSDVRFVPKVQQHSTDLQNLDKFDTLNVIQPSKTLTTGTCNYTTTRNQSQNLIKASSFTFSTLWKQFQNHTTTTEKAPCLEETNQISELSMSQDERKMTCRLPKQSMTVTVPNLGSVNQKSQQDIQGSSQKKSHEENSIWQSSASPQRKFRIHGKVSGNHNFSISCKNAKESSTEVILDESEDFFTVTAKRQKTDSQRGAHRNTIDDGRLKPFRVHRRTSDEISAAYSLMELQKMI